MLKNATNQDRDVQIADRRNSARVHMRSLAYIELDRDNGGLVLNISEGGIAVQSAEMLMGDFFQSIRFRLPKSEKWIETSGKLVWLGKTKKEAGIQFLDLNIDARQQIQSWIYAAAFRPGLPVEQGRFKIVWEIEEAEEAVSEPVPASPGSEFDSMFPSEKSLSPETFPGLNKPASLDAAIAPGPVKRPTGGLTAASSLSSYELPLVAPVRRAELDTEQGSRGSENVAHGLVEDLAHEAAGDSASLHPGKQAPETHRADTSGDDVRRFREAFVRPAGRPNKEGSARRDPFASAVVDESPSSDFRGSPSSSVSSATQVPAFPPRPVNLTGMGYQPAAFEEPSGKGWLIVGAVLIALLGFGTALAIGPANVKALLSRHLSLASLAGTGPPPRAAASDKPRLETKAPDAPDVPSGSMQFGGRSDSMLNPGVEPGPAKAPAPAETPAAAPAKSGDDAGASRVSPGTDTAEATASDLNETPEIAAAKTRQFQLEHSQSNAVPRTPPVPDGSFSRAVPTSAPPAAAPGSIPAQPNDRTMDAYAQSVPAASGSAAMSAAQTSPPPVGGSATTPAASVPAGTVAISSHFHSLRGEESFASFQGRPLQVGQLVAIHQPNYPTEAERAHVEGTVQLRATVDQVGRVEIVHLLSGPPMLVPAALEAVREWRYAPTILEGRAVESVNDVTVVFRLANSTSSPR